MWARSGSSQALDNQGKLSDPTGAAWTKTPKSLLPVLDMNGSAPRPAVAMSPLALSPAGGSQLHDHIQPLLPLRFSIALEEVYPPKQQFIPTGGGINAIVLLS